MEIILQLVSFNLGNEEFGIDIQNVSEILKMIDISCIPNSPFSVEGIVSVMGKTIPIIDTRARLNMNKDYYTKETRIIVVEIGNKIFGFIVYEVKEVIRIPKSKTEQLPDLATSVVNSEFITAIAHFKERFIIILHLKKLFFAEEVEIEY